MVVDPQSGTGVGEGVVASHGLPSRTTASSGRASTLVLLVHRYARPHKASIARASPQLSGQLQAHGLDTNFKAVFREDSVTDIFLEDYA